MKTIKNMEPNKTLIGKLMLAATCSVALALVTGCTSTNFDASNNSPLTAASVAGKTYKLVEGEAVGTSYGFKFLGIIPFANPHYGMARKDMLSSVQKAVGGRGASLSHETSDTSTIYVILFSIPKVTVTADVIEFVDTAAPISTTDTPLARPAAAPTVAPPVTPEK